MSTSPGHRPHHVLRPPVAAVEVPQVAWSDGVEVSGGHPPPEVVVLPVEQEIPLAAEQAVRVVVSLLQVLPHVLLTHPEPLGVEPRPHQHVEEEIEALLEHRGDGAERRPRLGVPGRGGDTGGEELDPFVQLRRTPLAGPAVAHHRRGQGSKPHLVRRVEEAPDLERHPQPDQRQGAVLDHDDRDAAAQFMVVVRAFGRLEDEVREDQLFGPVRNVLPGNFVGGWWKTHRHQGDQQ